MASHPLILKPEQDRLVRRVVRSSLIVAPTGFGKTIVAIGCMKQLPQKYTVLTPTIILCDQFEKQCQKYGIRVARIESTQKLLKKPDLLDEPVICLTPHLYLHLIDNPIIAPKLLARGGGLIIDQAHHYIQPTTRFVMAMREHVDTYATIWCFTASPGGKTNVKKIMKNFHLYDHLEGIPQAPYDKEITQVELIPPESWRRDQHTLSEQIRRKYRSVISIIGEYRHASPWVIYRNRQDDLSKVHLVNPSLCFQYWRWYKAKYHAYLHCHQAPSVAREYARRHGLVTTPLSYTDEQNPKIHWILSHLPERGAVIIFFDNYLTLGCVRTILSRSLPPDSIVGLAGKSKISLKARQAILTRIHREEVGVILATSVAEEGVDVKCAKKIFFWEPVSSKIRYLQRIGRTGRHEDGYVDILMFKDTFETTLGQDQKTSYKKAP